MKIVILLSLFFHFFICEATRWSECIVAGIEDIEWSFSGHKIIPPIDDTFRGFTANFSTKNIKAMQIEQHSKYKYLNATLVNDILTIFTTEHFNNFEEDRRGARNSQISILLNFDCANDTSESLTIYQEVVDVNSHSPIFNKNSYEYHFGMTIPADFELTELQTISASDKDFSNNNMYFTIEFNKTSEFIRLGYEGKQIYGSTKDYFTTLKVLKNISAPFREEFTIVATDDGHPAKSSKAGVVITVTSPEGNASSANNSVIQPPVFTKFFYVANYSSEHEIVMNEEIVIKYGGTNSTIIKQSGYEEYFKCDLDKNKVLVTNIKKLTKELLERQSIIVEIEGMNEGLLIPGKTILIIQLLKDSIDFNGTCDVIHVWGYTFSNSLLPFILFLTGMVCIVFLNILLIALCMRKRRALIENASNESDSTLRY